MNKIIREIFFVIAKPKLLVGLLGLFVLFFNGSYAFGEDEETMLMFVGEDIELLTIASRREESAWNAPAVAQVINRQKIIEQGQLTLADVVAKTPGFFRAPKEWGDRIYLRGVPDSTLFLYDTVPMGSDVMKALNPLGFELSLASVKRVEILRGASSVLWGPDAFAGIVNVVPLTGKDVKGIETGLIYGVPQNQHGAYMNWGHDQGEWNAFMSVSGFSMGEDTLDTNVVRFWNGDTTPVDPAERFGRRSLDNPMYLEASGNWSYKKILSISGRIADAQKPYSIARSQQDIVWQEKRSLPVGFIKTELNKTLTADAGLRVTYVFSSLQPEVEIINKTFAHTETTNYGEIIYDRTLFEDRGLLTSGLSFRHKKICDAPVWEDYLPDFLDAQNDIILPTVSTMDYTNRLWSVFGQYQHKMESFEFWLGLRNDAHAEYNDHVSFSAGLSCLPADDWRAKIIYGTAYRTPFARQVLEARDSDLEVIKSLSAQLAYKPSKQFNMSVGGFSNRIDNHIMADPYAGLSEPNHQTINGFEAGLGFSPLPPLDLSADLTWIDNHGPDEAYSFESYEIQDDGSIAPLAEIFRYPFDSGPRLTGNLGAAWRIHRDVTVFGRLNYFSSQKLIYPRGRAFMTFPEEWLLDLSCRVKDLLWPGLSMEISLKNVTDHDYQVPGTYSPLEGHPFEGYIILRKTW